jgi:hypothetical protein
MSIDPSQVPDPEIKPSSTPDGPQTIPTPNNPPHESPMGDPQPQPETQPGESVHFDLRASNPNSGGDDGLTGEMGISSERTGPAGFNPTESDVEGTGSKGTSVSQTDGTADTTPTEWDAVDVSQKDVQTDPQPDGTDAFADDSSNVDRTVGEPRPQPIADEKSRRNA